jgi:hypothetical protein
MNFDDYKARVFCFFTIFFSSKGLPEWKEGYTAKEFKQIRSESQAFYENMMNANPGKDYYIETPKVPINEIPITLGDINLLADTDTLIKQAEAVKNEIISIGNDYRESYTKSENRLKYLLTDYIRNPDGKIVYPFKYWEDCVNVFIDKHLFHKSNEVIADKYSFKSSKSGTQRAKLKLVSDMLFEFNRLVEAAHNNRFPPMVLKGKEQLRMLPNAEK